MILAALVTGGGLAVLSVVLGARYLEARTWTASLQALRLTMPAGLEPEDVAGWLGTIAAATHASCWSLLTEPPVVLEVVARAKGIEHVLLIPRRLRSTVLSGLRAALPGVRITDLDNYLKDRPQWTFAGELRLTNRRRPLAIDRTQAVSTALLATLQPLYGQETIVLQWTLTAAGTPAPVPTQAPRTGGADITRLLSDQLAVDSEAVRAKRAKQAAPLLHAACRIGVAAREPERARRLFGHVFGQLRGLNAPGVGIIHRSLLPSAVVGRQLHRLHLPLGGWPLLLNTAELAGLVGVPVGTVALPGLALGTARQLPPSVDTPTSGVELAVSNYPGMKRSLRLTAVDRLQHMHIIGPTGVGKSTLIARMALQDIAAGHAVIVIDPKSDLCADILARLPVERADDVIVLDPAAVDQPVGFNILRAGIGEQDRELIVDHVIHIWHELYREFWGPRSEDVLRAALLTLVNTRSASGEAFTLIEVPELLTNGPFRGFVLSQPTVPVSLRGFWTWYQGLGLPQRQQVIGPILNKLRTVTLRTPTRLMLGQAGGLDVPRLLRERKVLLAPLSKGTVGVETAGLIGTLLLSTLWQAILGRAALPPERRRPVMVYLDEAQDVLRLPVDLADMLAQARSLGGAFHLAHQHMGQITDRQVEAALTGTVRTSITFQLGHKDAAALAKAHAPHLAADDLRGLAAYEIALRPCIGGATRSPVTGTTLPLGEPTADPAALQAASRSRYGAPRVAVEAALAARIEPPAAQQTPMNHTNDTARPKPPTQPIGRRRKPKTSHEDPS